MIFSNLTLIHVSDTWNFNLQMYLDKQALQVPWVTMAGNHDHDGNVDAQIEFSLTEPLWYFPSLYYTFTTVTILINMNQ